MRIVVTVDTEADGQWEHGRPLTTANVGAWPRFQELCRRNGVRPTYLITSEIAADADAVAFLRTLVADGEAEVGSHLHPWTTPPYADEPGLRENDGEHAYPCQLAPDLLKAKLETLTDQVTEACGARPSCYRAGRFGLDGAGARLLAGLGYEVDSSVTPFVGWAANAGRAGRGGPDFRCHDALPFRVAGSGEPGLVEIPVTIMPTYALTRRVGWLCDHWEARPIATARRVLRFGTRPQPLWLRPRPEYSLDDLQALVRRAELDALPAAVFMFHSSELLAGASLYRPTPDSVAALLRLLEGLFAWIWGRGHEFVTLTTAGTALAATGRLTTKEL